MNSDSKSNSIMEDHNHFDKLFTEEGEVNKRKLFDLIALLIETKSAIDWFFKRRVSADKWNSFLIETNAEIEKVKNINSADRDYEIFENPNNWKPNRMCDKLRSKFVHISNAIRNNWFGCGSKSESESGSKFLYFDHIVVYQSEFNRIVNLIIRDSSQSHKYTSNKSFLIDSIDEIKKYKIPDYFITISHYFMKHLNGEARLCTLKLKDMTMTFIEMTEYRRFANKVFSVAKLLIDKKELSHDKITDTIRFDQLFFDI